MYKSYTPHGFREEDILCVFIVRIWKLMTPGVGLFLTPGASLMGFM